MAGIEEEALFAAAMRREDEESKLRDAAIAELIAASEEVVAAGQLVYAGLLARWRLQRAIAKVKGG